MTQLKTIITFTYCNKKSNINYIIKPDYLEPIMPFELPSLPYEKDALSPTISEETINFHYGKHHNAYVVNQLKYNKLLFLFNQ